MNFRFQKRINLGKSAGLNISKTGISGSYRTRYGSFGTRGFSLKTGVPGLTFISSWRKGNHGAIILLLLGVFVLAGLILYNLWRFLRFVVTALHIAIKNRRGSKTRS